MLNKALKCAYYNIFSAKTLGARYWLARKALFPLYSFLEDFFPLAFLVVEKNLTALEFAQRVVLLAVLLPQPRIQKDCLYTLG